MNILKRKVPQSPNLRAKIELYERYPVFLKSCLSFPIQSTYPTRLLNMQIHAKVVVSNKA